jgi:predicted DNA-binding transcriptional regulator AlpA
MQSRGALPAPVRPTRRAPRWRVDEIKAWLDANCPPRDRWEALKAARR